MADSKVPFNPSPAEGRYDQMRREGTCVTSPLFQTSGAKVNAIPVLVAPQPATASIPDPKHESMADG
jgi:hypothetical protein